VGESGVADITCTQCHDDTSRITEKQYAWAESRHGSGEAYVRGRSASCAGCHSGDGFTARIAEGLAPNEVEAGDPDPVRQECRTCHNIHTTYTSEDFSLVTTDPVTLFAIEGATFDGGEGNLCANCHQPRRVIAPAEGGMIEVTSTHWGPHHGGESSMILGVGGAGEVEGSPSAHASVVEDTCVTCHLGPDEVHTFEPSVAVCQECHGEVEDFDIEGVQTEVNALLAELEEALLARGMLAAEDLPPEADYLVDAGLLHLGHPHPVPGTYPEAEAVALWNWIFVALEDGSHGVHNPDYTIDLLEASLAALQ
jgi:hypothetical protein